ncbi:MAG: nicotinate (nicotinamide) nucleotide adenylyltransferase [Oscillospiraceae bacterium]|nr:nicotinate (nicotinamide) nucleotide adenylyltransferase [Oscillospiraceae bacterium]
MIGLLGGTFDPPHKGHLYLARTARRQLGLERVILIPAYLPPHKQVSGGATAAQRLAMARLAARGKKWMSVSDAEIAREGKSYTYDTLTELSARMPGERFCFLCGSDMLVSLEHWYRADELLRMAAFAALPRNEADAALMRDAAARLTGQGAEIHLLDAPPMELSSTEFRRSRDADKVPAAVFRYIEAHGLYGEETARQAGK